MPTHIRKTRTNINLVMYAPAPIRCTNNTSYRKAVNPKRCIYDESYGIPKVVTQSNDEVSSIIQLRQLHTKPSLPDLSCFHYAQTHNHVLLTGDSALRQLSENVRMEVHGTLWLLDELIAHKVMKKAGASTCLKAMCDNGSYLPKTECEKRFKRWK